MRILSRNEVCTLVQMPRAIELMRELFVDLGRQVVELQQRTLIQLHGGKDSVLFMPGHVSRWNRLGLKVVSVFPENRLRHGHSTINATILLADGDTGELTAVMDGTHITALRTGAVSAVATDLLALPSASNLAVFGAGVQARTQIEALLCVRPVTRIRIYDREPMRAAALAEAVTRDLGTRATVEPAATPADALYEADLIVTATTSSSPVFDGGLVKPGAHINAIGSFQPHTRELDDDIVARSRIIVDSREQALAEAGDLIQPLQGGVIGPESIAGTLGEVVIGAVQGRRSVDDITIFKSVGLAVEDIAVASYVFEQAVARSAGTLIASC